MYTWMMCCAHDVHDAQVMRKQDTSNITTLNITYPDTMLQLRRKLSNTIL